MKKGKIEKAMTFVGDYLIRNSPNSQFSKPFHKEDDTNPLSSSDDLDNEAVRQRKTNMISLICGNLKKEKRIFSKTETYSLT